MVYKFSVEVSEGNFQDIEADNVQTVGDMLLFYKIRQRFATPDNGNTTEAIPFMFFKQWVSVKNISLMN